MRKQLGDKVRVEHILEAILEIESYTFQVSENEFLSNSMMRNACAKQIEIIGEAVNLISDELKQKHAQVEWRKIAATRNFLVHEYFGIDYRVIWNIIQKDLPEFKSQLQQIAERLA